MVDCDLSCVSELCSGNMVPNWLGEEWEQGEAIRAGETSEGIMTSQRKLPLGKCSCMPGDWVGPG